MDFLFISNEQVLRSHQICQAAVFIKAKIHTWSSVMGSMHLQVNDRHDYITEKFKNFTL